MQSSARVVYTPVSSLGADYVFQTCRLQFAAPLYAIRDSVEQTHHSFGSGAFLYFYKEIMAYPQNYAMDAYDGPTTANGGISQLIDIARKQQVELDSAIAVLRDRLSPALGQSQPVNVSNGSAPRPVGSPLEDELRGLIEQIQSSRTVVEDIQRRLAL